MLVWRDLINCLLIHLSLLLSLLLALTSHFLHIDFFEFLLDVVQEVDDKLCQRLLIAREWIVCVNVLVAVTLELFHVHLI